MPIHDLVIVGGGPAGLSGALVAGRSRLDAVLIDGGTPRNAAAPAIHTFVTRDSVLPKDFRRIAHEQLAAYATVRRIDGAVDDIAGEAGAFEITLAGGERLGARHVVLALGLVDRLPDVPGLAERWGRGVHHCVFCDGFERRDQPWGLLVDDPTMVDHARMQAHWAAHVVAYTNGETLADQARSRLREAGVEVDSRRIARIRGGEGHALEAVEFANGECRAIESLWIRPRQSQTALVQRLGLALREDGAIARDERGETSIPGLLAAGDCSAGMMQQALFAAADGMRTTFSVLQALLMGTAKPH